MRVFGDDGRSSLEFDAYRAGVPELAWIVEDAALQDALWQALRAEVLAPAECERLETSGKNAVLTLRDGRRVTSALVVGADGANSFVRRAAGIAAHENGYGQAAVVANFRCEKPHRGVRASSGSRAVRCSRCCRFPATQVSMVWSLPRSRRSVARCRLDRRAVPRSRSGVARQRSAGCSLSTPPRQLSAAAACRAQRLVAAARGAGRRCRARHPSARGPGPEPRPAGRAGARRECWRRASRCRDPGDLRLLRRYERVRAEPILGDECRGRRAVPSLRQRGRAGGRGCATPD